MSAAVLKFEDYSDYQPKGKMKIPLQSEIASYMGEKMGWNKEFCTYYADKFWNYYNAQGWKLSNGNSMKDWKSAFNAQWQKPKFQEDIDLLNKTNKKRNINNMNHPEAVDMLDAVLMAYRNGFKPDRESALQIYEWLKQRHIIKLKKDQIEDIRQKAGNNNDSAKLWALKYYLDALVQNNIKFKDFL